MGTASLLKRLLALRCARSDSFAGSREGSRGPQASFTRTGADTATAFRPLDRPFTVDGSDAGLAMLPPFAGELQDVADPTVDPAHVLGVPGGNQMGFGLKLGEKRPPNLLY